MTFEEAEKKLNCGEKGDVVEAMRSWHPCILGNMLEAVFEARKKRSIAPHGNFERAVKRVAARERLISKQKLIGVLSKERELQ